jgi:hypothetical protein
MPVTARLSKLFYERLGEQIANELVDWFNAVDATYRADLRQWNEQNYARFDAKLEQRLAELKGELRSEIAGLRGELRSDMAGLRGALQSETASVRENLQTVKSDLIKWMLGFWIASVLTTIGGIAALARLLP